MTKAEVVAKIAQETGVERAVVAAVVDSFQRQVADALCDGQYVCFRSFGTFELKYCKPRVARNILKNEQLRIPARMMVRFRPSDQLTKRVNQSQDK